MGFGYILVVAFCIVVMTNSVNLTDGLDGLAIGCSVIMGLFFAVAAYISGCSDLSRYVNVPYVAGSWELSVFCAALVGGGLGFFWYNCFPAQVFMGDTGSLTLGGVLGLSGIIIRQEPLMFLVGGVFIAELGSSFVQRYYYKMTKKRVFRCAPLHHHFQFKGWQETDYPPVLDRRGHSGSVWLCFIVNERFHLKSWHIVIYVVVALLGFSLVTVYSVDISAFNSSNSGYRFTKHLLWILTGGVMLAAMANVDYHYLKCNIPILVAAHPSRAGTRAWNRER